MKIGLFVEGTYPFTRGGVSEWVHELIASQPENKFELIHLSSKSTENKKLRYSLDSKRVQLHEIALFDRPESVQEKNIKIKDLYLNSIFSTENSLDLTRFKKLISALTEIKKEGKIIEALIRSEEGFRFILSEYNRIGGQLGWVDAFYQMRSALLPVLRILSQEWPECDIYHSVSTGYAGLAACCAHLIHNKPFLVTEHGIYAFEREIELATVSWIPPDYEGDDIKDVTHNKMRSWWREHYDAMGKMAYHFASQIYSLTEMNRRMQLNRSADPKKIKIISNGVRQDFFKLGINKIQRNKELTNFTENHNKAQFVFGFVGRVVSIKDVKTLLRSFALTKSVLDKKNHLIELHCYGSFEEEPEYFIECQNLVRELGIESFVSWKGSVSGVKIYPLIDALVLTSVSEGQPLSILEAMASGVPVVSTRAGPCEEIVGEGGLVCDIADTEALSHAMALLVEDAELRFKLAERAFKTANSLYQVEKVWNAYQAEYKKYYQEDTL